MSSPFELPDATLVDDQGRATTGWLQVFSRWQRVILAAQQSGTTANRPTSLLWVGRRFYDTTLNKPVWVSSVSPVTWRDAAGGVV